MKAQVYLVRKGGIKIPDRESAAMTPLTGELMLDGEWVTEFQNVPALTLRQNVTKEGVLAILYDPRLVSMRANWMRFTGFEMLDAGDGRRQLVVQDWRCYLET